MASQAYYDWIDAGKPYTRSRPVQECRDVIRGHGYTVYDYPDDRHLLANPPEDHTPYSATGWPIASKRWVGHAIDIMPNGPVPLPVLARKIISDRDAREDGARWIKYLNWTDENGNCWHVSWQPDKKVTSSTDKGHIHISARSDVDSSDEVSSSGWDPVERAMADYTEAQMKAFPWQYTGRGIGENNGTTVARSMLSYTDEMLQLIRKIAQQVDIDPAELAAIEQAAQEGARAGVLSSVDAFVAAVAAKLPPAGATPAQVEAALREVFADASSAG